jgi:uncharacterized membrane protein YciS (DUF1049 family)
MSQWIKLIIVLACMAVGLAFHLRNNHLVTLDYFLGTREFYLSVWLLAALAAGVCLGFLAGLPWILRLKRHNHRLARQLRLTETAPGEPPPIPVKDS